MLDIDHFKAINDHYGHPAGDACLIDIANRIQSVAKNFDAVCARYGGEEFIILMADEDLSTASAAAQTLLSLIREVPVSVSGHSIRVTASIGVIARQPGSSDETDTLLKAADELLYQAKSQGRDQICSPESTNVLLYSPKVEIPKTSLLKSQRSSVSFSLRDDRLDTWFSATPISTVPAL